MPNGASRTPVPNAVRNVGVGPGAKTCTRLFAESDTRMLPVPGSTAMRRGVSNWPSPAPGAPKLPTGL
jgi:hypothetical protein